jgi:hypothetical protein
MKRTILALALMLALFPLQAPFVSIVNADINAKMPALDVLSPLQKSIYQSTEVMLNFEVTKPKSWSEVFPGYASEIVYWSVGVIKFVYYSLDGEVSENVTVDDDTSSLTIGPSSKVFDFSFNLTGLADGVHTVRVSVIGSYKGKAFTFSSSPLIFFVDTAPLELNILSPESRLYNTTDIPLTLTTTEPVLWLGYSLDEGARVTITENTTLKELATGSHNLTTFANDTLGNFAPSETITFTVAEPFPVALVATASGASAIIIVGCLLVYFKKRKH